MQQKKKTTTTHNIKKRKTTRKVTVKEAVCKVIEIPIGPASRKEKMRIEIGGWDGDESIDLKAVNFQVPCRETFTCSREEAKLIAETLIKHL